jgi:hypothetical protein
MHAPLLLWLHNPDRGAGSFATSKLTKEVDEEDWDYKA